MPRTRNANPSSETATYYCWTESYDITVQASSPQAAAAKAMGGECEWVGSESEDGVHSEVFEDAYRGTVNVAKEGN